MRTRGGKVTNLKKLRALAEAATQGALSLGNFPDPSPTAAVAYFGDMIRKGSGEVWAVVTPMLDGTPLEEEALYLAITGNGPTSESNARFIAVANPRTVLALIEALDVVMSAPCENFTEFDCAHAQEQMEVHGRRHWAGRWDESWCTPCEQRARIDAILDRASLAGEGE